MKKILLLALCLVLAVGMAACGSEPETENDDEIVTEDPADQADPADTGEQTEEGDLFTFSTETFEGETFTSEDVKDAKLVMINFWEPWCGPCVGEMPDLARVYEEHKDEGLVILGVFSETTMDEDAAQVLSDSGVTYPILRYSSDFDGFQTGYVPTTVFITGEGKLLSAEPIIGSQSYADWNDKVMDFLEELGND